MKLSIVIPCYNEADNLVELLGKITPLQQKYDLEYILVENGSTDGSKEVFQKNIENKYKNIKVIYVENNIGYGYGIQQGLKACEGDFIGYIHADLQTPIENLIQFFDYAINSNSKDNLFIKALRRNRSLLDNIFTLGQALVDSIIFRQKLFDIAAIPILFSKNLIEKFNIDDMPNDFSIELYLYLQSKIYNFEEKRINVIITNRQKGNSSWNTGIMSKIKQSMKIMSDSILIKKGEKVL